MASSRLICTECGRKDPIDSGLVGWRGRPKAEGGVDPFCPDCATDLAESISMEGIKIVDPDNPDAPMVGAFRPVRVGDDLRNYVSTIPFGKLWREVEIQLTFGLQDLAVLTGTVAMVTDEWDGLSFTVTTLPSGEALFSAPSRDTDRRDRLNVYQVYRLRRMGLEYDPDTTRWSVRLTPEENTPRNIARIIVHLGLFVYSITPNWISEVLIDEGKP